MSIKTRAQQIASVSDRIPEDVRPSQGSFEDRFMKACIEVALSAYVDEDGVSTVPPAAVQYIARLLCGRSLSSGDCHASCQLQRHCVGASNLVLASFGAQVRLCLEALGLQVETDQAKLGNHFVRRAAQPLLLEAPGTDFAT